MCKDIKKQYGCGCTDFSPEHCKDWYEHRNKPWDFEPVATTGQCDICFHKAKLDVMVDCSDRDDEGIKKLRTEVESMQRDRLQRQREKRETEEAKERERVWKRDQALQELNEACQSGSEGWIETAVKAVLDNKPKEGDGERVIMQHVQMVQNVLGFNSIEEAYHDVQKRKVGPRERFNDDQDDDTEVEESRKRRRRTKKSRSLRSHSKRTPTLE
ncbi:hypothetical protein MBLNU457_5692t1 [Dothideomycetes sp. NU457]